MVTLPGTICTKQQTRMFTSEQNNRQNLKIASKKAVSGTGTTFAKSKVMKRRITYKEVTLALGIVVAVLVALTLWVTHPAEKQSSHTTIIPYISSLTAVKSIIHAAVEMIF
jgi:hypothetical protein